MSESPELSQAMYRQHLEITAGLRLTTLAPTLRHIADMFGDDVIADLTAADIWQRMADARLTWVRRRTLLECLKSVFNFAKKPNDLYGRLKYEGKTLPAPIITWEDDPLDGVEVSSKKANYKVDGVRESGIKPTFPSRRLLQQLGVTIAAKDRAALKISHYADLYGGKEWWEL